MDKCIAAAISKMTEYESGNERRINHFLKVHAFASAIAADEGLDDKTTHILELAAVLHDIGIKPSYEKHGSASGRWQQIEGPAPARAMLGG
ncbi:MAG: HD domain-containing protein, partial [Christensenellaceae bacterium]|nr:HD domain-containing protein [Christensenellaceae bacterium]